MDCRLTTACWNESGESEIWVLKAASRVGLLVGRHYTCSSCRCSLVRLKNTRFLRRVFIEGLSLSTVSSRGLN